LLAAAPLRALACLYAVPLYRRTLSALRVKHCRVNSIVGLGIIMASPPRIAAHRFSQSRLRLSRANAAFKRDVAGACAGGWLAAIHLASRYGAERWT
jgi:hypothetical protein